MLDLYPMDNSDPAENYRTIRKELESFSPMLAEKREIVAANKMDLAIDDEAIDRLRRDLPDKQIFAISGASHHGVQHLLDVLWKVLQEMKADATAKCEIPKFPRKNPWRGLPISMLH